MQLVFCFIHLFYFILLAYSLFPVFPTKLRLGVVSVVMYGWILVLPQVKNVVTTLASQVNQSTTHINLGNLVFQKSPNFRHSVTVNSDTDRSESTHFVNSLSLHVQRYARKETLDLHQIYTRVQPVKNQLLSLVSRKRELDFCV